MKKLLMTAAAMCAVAAPAMAEESGISFSGNVALTSNYVFRGITQTDNNPAIQGGFDASYGQFYAGTWASNTQFGVDDTIEMDFYAGVKPTLGPVSTDLGVVYYAYPDADDGAIAGDLDYLEVYGKASIAPVEPLTLGAAVFYSPEFPLKGGDAWYGEVNAGYTLTDALAVSGAFGYQTTKTNGYFAGDDNYMTWNIGATYSIAGFGLDVRYSDTDVSNADGYKDKFFVTLKRAL